MTNLIIGNCISLVAAFFTFASCYSHRKERIYFYQVGQCLILSVANLFFGSYAGIITLALCALRNYLLGINKFGKISCITIASLMLVFGAMINNNKAVGWIVISANVIYTVWGYFARKELSIKLNIIVDLTLWIIYEILILDIPSLIADIIGVVIAAASVIRLLRQRNTESNSELPVHHIPDGQI